MRNNRPIVTCPEEEAYLAYIDEHCNNVLKAFIKDGDTILLNLGISNRREDLLFRVKTHDVSKYGEDEFEAYRNYFYPKEGEKKDRKAFDIAWKHHYTHNSHHWEFYLDEDGNPKPMKLEAVAEMLLDWEAMSIKFGGNPYNWYQSNKDKIKLHPDTKFLVEHALQIIFKNWEWVNE